MTTELWLSYDDKDGARCAILSKPWPRAQCNPPMCQLLKFGPGALGVVENNMFKLLGLLGGFVAMEGGTCTTGSCGLDNVATTTTMQHACAAMTTMTLNICAANHAPQPTHHSGTTMGHGQCNAATTTMTQYVHTHPHFHTTTMQPWAWSFFGGLSNTNRCCGLDSTCRGDAMQPRI
ncbi:hypothetical protein BU15DRAFT_60655 [Melanogaster broomeanus]|nr:hypothetical protein BU15DRAFT_60655 [Melanogaster broomeanus]